MRVKQLVCSHIFFNYNFVNCSLWIDIVKLTTFTYSCNYYCKKLIKSFSLSFIPIYRKRKRVSLYTFPWVMSPKAAWGLGNSIMLAKSSNQCVIGPESAPEILRWPAFRTARGLRVRTVCRYMDYTKILNCFWLSALLLTG